MRYVSLFSGIEAASVAWQPLGWEAVAFAEIDPFACAVLAERFPGVPNLGDVSEIDWKEFLESYGAIDLVCGGSPCQSFSIAGGRESLDGESRLMFEYIRAVDEIRPRWFVWENVPGVLNTHDDAFGCFIRSMDEIGFSTAWRVLDAQFFGVAQRRRRVWAVGANRDAFGDLAVGRAAAVLFERESLRGNTQSSGEKRQGIAAATERGAGGSYTLKLRHTGSDNPGGGVGPLIQDDVSATLATFQDQTLFCIQGDGRTSLNVNGQGFSTDGSAFTLNCTDRHSVLCMGSGQADAPVSEGLSPTLTALHEQPILCLASQNTNAEIGDNLSPTLTASAESTTRQPVLCMANDTGGMGIDEDIAGTLRAANYGCAFICAETTGALCAADHKGAGNQYVEEGKLVTTFGFVDSMGAKAEGAWSLNREIIPERGTAQGPVESYEIAPTLDTASKPHGVVNRTEVRRLTPTECERLQGFPDGWTKIPYRGKPADKCPDGPRYKALGNSWAVPCARWIGERIEFVEEVCGE